MLEPGEQNDLGLPGSREGERSQEAAAADVIRGRLGFLLRGQSGAEGPSFCQVAEREPEVCSCQAQAALRVGAMVPKQGEEEPGRGRAA